MRTIKTKHYKALPPQRGLHRCEFELWDKVTRRPVKCGAGPALAIKGEKGGHIAFLCREHADFFLDAHDMRSEEEKEAANA